jgi:hypothetical protein
LVRQLQLCQAAEFGKSRACALHRKIVGQVSNLSLEKADTNSVK